MRRKTTVEIVDRKTGEVVETKENIDLQSFKFYFDQQCDRVNYSWREKSDANT